MQELWVSHESWFIAQNMHGTDSNTTITISVHPNVYSVKSMQLSQFHNPPFFEKKTTLHHRDQWVKIFLWWVWVIPRDGNGKIYNIAGSSLLNGFMLMVDTGPIPKITSCAHKWGQYTPALITTHLIQKYQIKISILQSCATQVGILQENFAWDQIFGHQRAENEARNTKMYRDQ